MEILITIDKYKNVIYIGGFNEKIESTNNYYIEISEDKFNEYVSIMPNLYYEDNKFVEKKNFDIKLLIQKKQNDLIDLKNNLQNTDYQIIKCYEAFMRQQPLPYNLEELSAQRDAWRAEINALEEELLTL
jgi:hypothetical protein